MQKIKSFHKIRTKASPTGGQKARFCPQSPAPQKSKIGFDKTRGKCYNEKVTFLKGEKELGEKYKFVSKKKKERINLSGNEKIAEIKGVHIEMFSNKEITIDGCCGVYEYGDDYLRLNIGKGSVVLCGCDFDIVFFEDRLITVKGNISNLEFCV